VGNLGQRGANQRTRHQCSLLGRQALAGPASTTKTQVKRQVTATVANWPKDITVWHEGDTGYMSVPFTWLLPKARHAIRQRTFFASRWVVGGPAVQLMPDYLADTDAEVGGDMPGVLQRVNPYATRTTTGCPNRCQFCGIGRRLIEGDFCELPDWPDGPILCDNNLLAASREHFERVIDRLRPWGWCDFNQGLDARLLTPWHAARIATLRRPMVRLALDSDSEREVWARAVDYLLTAGIAKRNIRTYVLCGFRGSPEENWLRCEFVQSFKIRALPMWFHPLDALEYGAVTEGQQQAGWTKQKQRQLMQWYYKHRGSNLVGSAAQALTPAP